MPVRPPANVTDGRYSGTVPLMARTAAAAVQNNDETTRPGGVTGKGFKPGTSGNPSGRPKGVARRIRDEYGDDAGVLITNLGIIALDSKSSASDRISATKLLLERGWGKAPVHAPVEDGDPLELAEAVAEEIAASFDRRVDELAERRERTASRKKPAARKRKAKP